MKGHNYFGCIGAQPQDGRVVWFGKTALVLVSQTLYLIQGALKMQRTLILGAGKMAQDTGSCISLSVTHPSPSLGPLNPAISYLWGNGEDWGVVHIFL